MKRNSWIIATAVAGVVMTQSGLAQREPDGTQQSTEPKLQRETPGVGTPPYVSRTETRATLNQTNLARVSELIGSNLSSQDGQKLGAIEDLVVNGQAQNVQFVILGKGGFFGIGEKLIPVPWRALNMEEGQHDYVLNVDQQKLKSAPTLQGQRYADLDRVEFTSRVYEFYGVQPEAAGATRSQTELQKGQKLSGEEQQNGQLPSEQGKELK